MEADYSVSASPLCCQCEGAKAHLPTAREFKSRAAKAIWDFKGSQIFHAHSI